MLAETPVFLLAELLIKKCRGPASSEQIEKLTSTL